MIKKIILPVVTLLLVSTAIAATLNVGVAEELTLREMLGRHVDRLMRKDGILLPTREPVTNWFGRVIMRGDDVLSPGYHYIQMRDDDAYAEVRDEYGVYEGEVAPLSEDAVFMLGDFFGFIPGEDTPEYMRLSHLVSKWQVFESAADSENADYNEEELEILISRASRKIRRLADAPLIVTNLQVTAVNAGTEDFTFVVEWPSTMTFPMNRIDIYSSVDLKGAWSYYDSIDSTGVNAATVTVQKASIPGWSAAVPLRHDDDCFATTNIVASAFDPLASYTNITWNCDHKSTAETPGFFRLADRSDSDNDGITDAAEKWVYSFDTTDTDGDGMPDWWEIAHGFDPNAFGEELDSDQDGLPDSKEIELGTNSNNPDSDGDGVDDGDEFYAGTNPLDCDTDGDGILDGEEFEYGTNPLVAENFSTYSPVATLALASTTEEEDIFDGPQEYYDDGSPGPAFELIGNHSVTITFTNETTSSFSVMGVAPPGDTITRPANTTQGVWYNETGPGHKNEFDLEATGVAFRPLKTGYFSFQVHSDDTATLNVGGEDGATASSDYYGDNPSPIAKKFFVAGESYDVSISAHNNGGPAELSIPVFGDFEPALKPQLALKTSADAVIFEKAYHNLPRQEDIPLRSSEINVAIGIRGGALGGHFYVATVNSQMLSNSGGDDIRFLMQNIMPNSTNVWHGSFIGIDHSVKEDDIKIIATFVENQTGSVYAITNLLTSIEIEVEAKSQPDMTVDIHRHIFGVMEKVDVRRKPKIEGVTWNFPSDLTVAGLSNGDKEFVSERLGTTVYPWRTTIEASYKGASLSTEVIIVAPRIIAKDPWINPLCYDSSFFLEAGRLLMHFDYYAVPSFVYFGEIQIREAPDESQSGIHSGYFDDVGKAGSWSHSSLMGAGDWHNVNSKGMIGTDKAGIPGHAIGPYIDGELVWQIPMEWGVDKITKGVIQPNPVTLEKFGMTSWGTVSVWKIYYFAERNRCGMFKLNGKRYTKEDADEALRLYNLR